MVNFLNNALMYIYIYIYIYIWISVKKGIYFYSTNIGECGKDQKKLFKLTRNLMGSNSNSTVYLCLTPGRQVQQFLHKENNNQQE